MNKLLKSILIATASCGTASGGGAVVSCKPDEEEEKKGK